MTLKNKLLGAVLTLGVATCLPAWADQPGANWISVEKVQQILKSAGYTQVAEIEADDGRWEGEGIKKDGLKYEFHVDPISGRITKEERDD